MSLRHYPLFSFAWVSDQRPREYDPWPFSFVLNDVTQTANHSQALVLCKSDHFPGCNMVLARKLTLDLSDMPAKQFNRLPVLSHHIQGLDLGHVHQKGSLIFGWFFSQPVQGRHL